jgi:CO/xanthine dehydrogenase FAD-binding subunit
MGQTAATHNRRGIKETDRMKAFGYVSAKDVAHAVALLGEHGAKAKILAGGTDLLVELKHAVHNPEIIVDVSRLAELKEIVIADDGLHIGALATHTDIMNAPIISGMFPALVEAAHSIGAVQTRNLGTLGGNLITCVPSVDSGPALIALDAVVTVASAEGERRMPLAELFVGPRKTSLKPGDLLIDIIIPKDNLDKPAAFEKFGLRKGQALALVNVGASFWVGDKSVFKAPRIALGAVAPTVIRAPKAEAYLAGRTISVEAMAEVGRIAATEAKPISDFRASADYRRDLVAVLVKRALASALARATAKQKELVA